MTDPAPSPAQHARSTLRLLIGFGVVLLLLGAALLAIGLADDDEQPSSDDYTTTSSRSSDEASDGTAWIIIGAGLGGAGQLMLLVGLVGTGVRLGIEASSDSGARRAASG